MEQFDAHLQFDLPSGFEPVRETDDEGKATFSIATGKTTDDEGKVSYEFKMAVIDYTEEGPTPLDSAFQDNNAENRVNRVSLKGTAENVALTYLEEQAILFMTFRIAKFFFFFRVSDRTYGLLVLRAMSEDGQETELPVFAERITAVLNSLRIDGKKPGFDPVSDTLFTDAAEEAEETSSRFPVASPKKEQTPHYSFLKRSKGMSGLFGGMLQINQTGTEYSFVPVEDYAQNEDEQAATAALKRAAEMKGSFPLSEEAKKMSLLFRVTPEAFDPGEDREQEIVNGYLRRVEHFEALRSFIWTVKQYCEVNGTEPARLKLDELTDLVAFLKKRKWLNYSENGARGFCDGADIHNFYVSDAVSASDKKIIKAKTESDGDVFSLEAVRAELSYVYPAVRTLYEDLTYDRDRDQPLVSDEADVLYAWCSAAYAARDPFYTEDGPMNCFYDHPEVEPEWQRESRRYHEEQVKEWNKKYGNMIEKIPRILFSGKLFVFSGLTGREDWPEILEKLTAKGGSFRSAVSGKTDYLVVDPDDLGESKLRAVKEQKVKGHTVTVISANDFLKAIGMPKKEEKKEEIVLVSREEPKHRPADPKEFENKKLTCRNGKYAEAEQYSVPIPDGFAAVTDPGERAFILYATEGVQKDDYQNASFAIYDSNFKSVDLTKQFGTTEEYATLAKLFVAQTGAQTAKMFSYNDVWPFERRDMPGSMVVGFDDGALHVNAFLAVKDGIQMIRLQITGIRRRDLELYRKIVSAYLCEIRPKKPVALCDQPDDKKWTDAPLTEASLKDWSKCLEEYEKHLQTAFAIMHKGLTAEIETKQSAGFVSPDELKLLVRKNLNERVSVMEDFLRRVLSAYQEISRRSAGNPLLRRLRDTAAPYAEKADMNINVDEEPVSVESAYAKEFRKQLETPELRALDEAEKEEKRRREEEARKAAEEKKNKDENERSAYYEAMEDWREAKRKAEADRQAELDRRWEARKNDLIRQYDAEFADTSSQAEADISAAETKKAEAEKALASLGMFKFSEKKEQKALIAEAAAEIVQIGQVLSKAKEDRDNAVSCVENERVAYVASQKTAVESVIPLPKEPKKPGVILREEAEARKEKERKEAEARRKDAKEKARWERMTPRQREEETIKKKVLVLVSDGKRYRCTEILAKIPELSETSGTQRISRLCNDLCSQGLLAKDVVGQIVYFHSPVSRQSASSVPGNTERGSAQATSSDYTDYSSEKASILAAMVLGRKYRCSEIKAMVPALSDMEGTQRTARLCNDLCSEGLLKKTIDMKIVYYSLAE